MNIASNIINLADHRKFVMPVEDEEVSIKELFPEHLQAGIAAIELEMEQAKQDHQRFLRMARTFKPSEIPVFINPLLAPLWNLRFDNAKLKDLFVPLRSKVTAYQYNKLYKRFGLYFEVGSMFGDEPYFNLWVCFGADAPSVQRIRAAYQKKGLDWIECIMGSAVDLRVDKKPPQFTSRFKGEALLQIPRLVEGFQ
ncbi:hypothetical protein PQH03_04700 [Ralstonia insidiosa]|jgi:hypothetical protein|uniref:hypothetical protein n=1 Tax=Ralstonia TaxID=48736 RepID=UPI0006648CDE|nr:hypothetical protein [Ralstonia insidiosa]KMW48861.1 hypothetical protein AC240_03020 [Ralstonia sp. MD27]MBX3773414.1 hypothetical protein [Ralstonia pickettii]NOZ18810.1 hypothetical protein [Betaproteobacteria bacterium]MBA9857255.1 hypothetical protein [Ralstonia insidiosa]MBA9870585.1 hypothetical protein [Ralstonia insidiosa]